MDVLDAAAIPRGSHATAPAFGVGTHARQQRTRGLDRLTGGVSLRAQSCRRMP
jgi:hypothetical protein